MRTYSNGIPSDLRFIKVTGEDGTFYDLCRGFETGKHIDMLKNEGYTATIIRRKEVPPCQFRDFSDGLESYTDATWKNGSEFYWGGPRPGAGRPPTGRKSRQIWLSDDEHTAVKAYIKQIREEGKNEK